MVRYADKYDPDLAAAFEKLERGLPSPLAEHVERTLDGLSKAPRDERFSANVRLLTQAWAERRVVTIDYTAGQLRAGRDAAAGDGPAVPHRAVAPDPRPLPDRLRRGARRDPDVQDRADPDRRADPADLRAARPGGHDLGAPGGLGHHRRPAAGRGRPALRAGRREPRARGDLAPDPARRDRGRRLAPLARDRRRHDRDPAVDPVSGATTSRSSRRPRCATTSPTRIAARWRCYG